MLGCAGAPFGCRSQLAALLPRAAIPHGVCAHGACGASCGTWRVRSVGDSGHRGRMQHRRPPAPVLVGGACQRGWCGSARAGSALNVPSRTGSPTEGDPLQWRRRWRWRRWWGGGGDGGVTSVVTVACRRCRRGDGHAAHGDGHAFRGVAPPAPRQHRHHPAPPQHVPRARGGIERLRMGVAYALTGP